METSDFYRSSHFTTKDTVAHWQVHFDIETSNLSYASIPGAEARETQKGKEVYLWGLLRPSGLSMAPRSMGSGSGTISMSPLRNAPSMEYDYAWSDGGIDGDRQAWETFLEYIRSYLEEFGENMKLVHYSPVEPRAVLQYAERYGARHANRTLNHYAVPISLKAKYKFTRNTKANTTFETAYLSWASP